MIFLRTILNLSEKVSHITHTRCKVKMERVAGFEPTTSILARLHSTAELFPLNSICSQKKGGYKTLVADNL